MVDRMRDALAGEMNRRQELLRSAGNFANVTEYERARANGAALDPLPALFIVVDEFSELLSQKPDFAELFVMIGRLGRSLHIHLLLASQRLEEGKLRGLDSHLSYRIGLKTFSAGESRSVLGVPDAYHLPSVPGSAFLKCDADEPIRFNASYVSGEYVKPRISSPTGPDVTTGRAGAEAVHRHTGRAGSGTGRAGRATDADEPESETSAAPIKTTLLDVVVGRLRGHGRPAHEVWLPPLEASPAVNVLLPDLGMARSAERQRPLAAADRRGGPPLRPAPRRADDRSLRRPGQRRGGRRSAVGQVHGDAHADHGGRGHPHPEQLQFYCLDFGGGTLGSLTNLPHVGSVAGRMDADRIRRTVAEVTGLLRERELRFRDLGIESMRDFRQRKAQLAAMPPEEAARDPLSQDKFGDVVLVVDGWATIRSDFEMLEPALAGHRDPGPVLRHSPRRHRQSLDGDPACGQGHARHPRRAAHG